MDKQLEEVVSDHLAIQGLKANIFSIKRDDLDRPHGPSRHWWRRTQGAKKKDLLLPFFPSLIPFGGRANLKLSFVGCEVRIREDDSATANIATAVEGVAGTLLTIFPLWSCKVSSATVTAASVPHPSPLPGYPI